MYITKCACSRPLIQHIMHRTVLTLNSVSLPAYLVYCDTLLSIALIFRHFASKKAVDFISFTLVSICFQKLSSVISISFSITFINDCHTCSFIEHLFPGSYNVCTVSGFLESLNSILTLYL